MSQIRPTIVARASDPPTRRRAARHRYSAYLAATLATLCALPPAQAAAQRTDVTPPFRAVVRALSPAERTAMTPSVWRPGCPVGLNALRRVQMRYIDFNGRTRVGALVVHNDAARDVVTAFRRMYVARYRIGRMVPIERFSGDDYVSIEANNTSAFNCRPATGSSRWSQHAYGRAIDINPLQNPYVLGGRTSHPRSVPFLRRTPVRRGMIVEGGPVVRAFDRLGWEWGGRWSDPVDYQHFSARGR